YSPLQTRRDSSFPPHPSHRTRTGHPLVRTRASDSVIHPRSPTGRSLSDADNASSSTALSLRASGGVTRHLGENSADLPVMQPTKFELERVPPQLNQGDSRGAEDGRVYRH